MTPSEALLQKLDKWRPSGTRQTARVTEGAWTIDVTADRADELGCLVWELGVRRSGAAAALDAAGLKAWGERVAERATGLMEPLKLVEVDAPRGEALLRSEAPTPKGDDLLYYEVLLRSSGTGNLRRYRGSHQTGNRREQVPFALTHEALAKLAGDLTAER